MCRPPARVRRAAWAHHRPGRRVSVPHDDVGAVLQVVDGAPQDLRQQAGHLLPLLLGVGKKDGYAAARHLSAAGDDGHDAALGAAHRPSTPFSAARSGGQSPEATGLRTVPSRTGTYSTARTRACSFLSRGTMARTTSPVAGFWRAMGVNSGSSTSILTPSSMATSWVMAWRCPRLARVARALASLGRMMTASPSSM